MTATAVPRETKRPPAPQVVTSIDDILLELVDIGDNVRDDPGDLAELQASIAESGLLQPVKVTAQPDGRYRLVYGQRRVLAHQAMGRQRIRAIVEPASDVDAKGARRSIEQLAENLIRKDLNPIEEAVALREVLDETPGLTQDALADRLGRSRPWVSNTLRLLQADPGVQDAVKAGKLSASHAKSLVVLPAQDQLSLVRRVVENGLSAHELERELGWKLDSLKRREATAARTAKAIPKVVAALEAAEVAKDVQVLVRGAYNLDSPPIIAAIKKAGWPILTQGYAYDRPPDGKCDCKVVTASFNRTWQIEPGCVDEKHRDRQRNADHQVDEARRKAIGLRVEELRARVLVALEAVPLPILLLAHGDVWSLPTLVKNSATEAPAEIRDLVSKAMADRADASRVYNDRRRASVEEALESLIAMLPEPAPATAKKGGKAAAG